MCNPQYTIAKQWPDPAVVGGHARRRVARRSPVSRSRGEFASLSPVGPSPIGRNHDGGITPPRTTAAYTPIPQQTVGTLVRDEAQVTKIAERVESADP